MQLYVVNNRPWFTDYDPSYDWEDLHWALVWANKREEILELYRESYNKSMHDYGELLTDSCLDIEDITAKVSYGPEEDRPHLERRILVEREAGFRIPGESCCENCEMAANDIDEYRVCSECYLCKECRRWVNENDQSEEVCPECLPYLDEVSDA